MINHQLIELIETSLSEKEIWGDGIFRDSILYPQETIGDVPVRQEAHRV